MAYLTTFCATCQQVALIDQQHLLNGRVACERCGSIVGVVPGCSFGRDALGLFEDLKQIVAESAVDAREAKSFVPQLANALRVGNDRGLLAQLTGRLPGLLPIEIAAGANQDARQRVLQLLRAIFEALGQGELR